MHIFCHSLIIILFCLCASTAFAEEEDNASSVSGYSMSSLVKLNDQIESTGMEGRIAAISNTQFVSVSDASLAMEDTDIVFIITFPDSITRIYPQRILVWHEVVNDTLPDSSYSAKSPQALTKVSHRQYSITYSPLSGCVVAFKSQAGRFSSSFAATGDLLNANNLLYDRVSHSTWSQLLGASIDGPLRGKRLERIPVLWATWKGVKKRYAEQAEVLSRSTGYKRNYNKDPYGSYSIADTYYDDTRVLRKLSFLDKRLHPKKRILGIEHEAIFGALQIDAVKKQKVLNFSLGITPMVAFYDEEIEAVRVFDRRPGGKKDAEPLVFKLFENQFTDSQSNSKWSTQGAGIYGRYREKQLVPVFTIDCMWMTWAAFHRNTQIIPADGL